jgi:shikimate kinase
MVQSVSISVTDAPILRKKHFVEPGKEPAECLRFLHKRIALNGFMGSGKSTVARLLARQIGWLHADLDKRIVERSGLTIAEIFARRGEPVFRKLEHEELKSILGEAVEQSRSTIISLGGGTTCQKQNVDLLRGATCATIWLHCPIESLLQRCSHVTDRPLFRDEESFRQLYEQRLPAYELSDYQVESSVEPLRVVQQIISLGILEGVPA